jgi:hypothetical protein
MYTLGALGVAYNPSYPAWGSWQPGQQIDPYDIPDEILDTWRVTRPGQKGWYPTSQSGQVGCYCWGYRPANNPVTVDGSRWANQRQQWKICPFACPEATCPTPPAPPPCPTCPTPAPCPTCPEAYAAPGAIERDKNWLWAIGFGVLVAGVYGVRRTMRRR